jgi:hypothetical protein
MLPWFIAIAFIGAIGAVAFLWFRLLKATKDKVDRGDARWEDDWDPFT